MRRPRQQQHAPTHAHQPRDLSMRRLRCHCFGHHITVRERSYGPFCRVNVIQTIFVPVLDFDFDHFFRNVIAWITEFFEQLCFKKIASTCCRRDKESFIQLRIWYKSIWRTSSDHFASLHSIPQEVGEGLTSLDQSGTAARNDEGAERPASGRGSRQAHEGPRRPEQAEAHPHPQTRRECTPARRLHAREAPHGADGSAGMARHSGASRP